MGKVRKFLITIGMIIIIICLAILGYIKFVDNKIQKESDKLETLVVKTKSGEEIETEYTHIEESKFHIKIPKSFALMDYDIITKKYNGDVPDVVFSNEKTTINVAINITENQIKNEQIKSYKEQIEKLLKENNEIISTNYYKIDDYNIGQIKLISKATDTDIYNNMIFFSYNDKLVIVTFNCTNDLKEEWQEVGDFIIGSIVFTE